MRDYAEVGRQLLNSGRRTSSATRGLTRFGEILASPVTTISLELLLAMLLLASAATGSPHSMVEDATRFALLSQRAVLVLLALNLLAMGAQNWLPHLWPSRASASDLVVKSTLATRRAIPFCEEAPPLQRWLKEAGAGGSRTVSPQVALGTSGRFSGVGVALLHLGALLLLAGYTLDVDDPNPGEITLQEGHVVETVRHPLGGTELGEGKSFTRYVGYNFDIKDARGLLRLWEPKVSPVPVVAGELQLIAEPKQEVAQLMLTPLIPLPGTDSEAEDEPMLLPFNARGRVTLPNGAMLRLKRVREISTPGSVELQFTNSDGYQWTTKVKRGSQVSIPNGGMTLLSIDRARRAEMDQGELGSLGPAVQFAASNGDTFWFYQQAPGLSRASLKRLGVEMEIKGFEPQIEAVFEYVQPQTGFWAVAGVVLLLVGGIMTLAQSHTTIEVQDEVDRLVLRATSLNDMAHLPERLMALADQQATACTKWQNSENAVEETTS